MVYIFIHKKPLNGTKIARTHWYKTSEGLIFGIRNGKLIPSRGSIIRAGDKIAPDIVILQKAEVMIAISLKEDIMKFKIDYEMYVEKEKLYMNM